MVCQGMERLVEQAQGQDRDPGPGGPPARVPAPISSSAFSSSRTGAQPSFSSARNGAEAFAQLFRS